MNGENIIRISRIILIPDNAADTSLFCLPVQANGADAFKLALCLISSGLQGIDARIGNTLHDEIIVEARDGIEDQVEAIVKESMQAAFKRIVREVPFVTEVRVADSWKSWSQRQSSLQIHLRTAPLAIV
ncbi:MAG: DNA polymerase [Syntrophobacteraceae bacterium]